jgi:hypothetical protein
MSPGVCLLPPLPSSVGLGVLLFGGGASTDHSKIDTCSRMTTHRRFISGKKT